MRTITIAAVATLAISAVCVAVAVPFDPASASGAGGPAQLKLVVVEQHCGGADLPPADGSPGDIAMCRGRLQHPRTGAIAGAAAWFCPYVGTKRAGSLCTAVASLREGDLQLAGRLNHLSARNTWAITGGTGRYSNARGTAELRQVDDAHTTVTLRLTL
jgi:hypothetical protein